MTTFALVALVAIATPGPTVLLALANGSRWGLKRSLPGMFGAVASDFVLVGAAALGLGALLAASEFWFTVVKWLGAAYLAWLGVRLLRCKGLDLTAAAATQSDASTRAVFGYAAMGAHAIRLLRRRAVLWLDRCCGAALLMLSGSLLFYKRTNSTNSTNST